MNCHTDKYIYELFLINYEPTTEWHNLVRFSHLFIHSFIVKWNIILRIKQVDSLTTNYLIISYSFCNSKSQLFRNYSIHTIHTIDQLCISSWLISNSFLSSHSYFCVSYVTILYYTILYMFCWQGLLYLTKKANILTCWLLTWLKQLYKDFA